MEDPLLTIGAHDVSEFASLLVPGDNVLAVEGLYTGESLSTLSLAATLTPNFPRGPFIQNSTPSSVQIIWRTATPASSFVRYGFSPAVATVVTNEELVRTHVVTLTNLTPDTKYFYQVGSATNSDSAPIVSGVEWFRTLKTSGPIMFAALGDTGDTTSAQRQIAAVMQNLNPELVIHQGDVIYTGFNDTSVDTRVFNIYTQMRNTPFFFSAGNHDLNCCGGLPDNTLTNFQNAFYLPTNSADGTELFYSFDHGDAHFVALFNPWFTSYVFTNGTAQYHWLTNDLASSNKKWKFLFFHNPIAHSGNPHSLADRDANGVLDQTQLMHLLQPMAEQYGVQLIFSGHDHTFEKFAPTNGLHHVVSGGGGHSSLYSMATRHIATAQHRPIHHCLKVTVDGDVLRADALSTGGAYIDGFVINRVLPEDRIYASTWNTPVLETAAANNGDGNITGQTFDLVGPSILPRHGRFSNLGEFYANNDSTNLYLGFRNPMFYRDNNIFLFVESPRQTGVSNMVGVGNGTIDPADQGADGLDCLENLTFTNFVPSIGCILGDELGDRATTNNFARAALALNIGQGVFRLNGDLTAIASARMQQFNRSPETGPVANDSNADFIEVSIPFAELGGLQPGDVIKAAALAAGPEFDATNQTRQLDTAVLGASLEGSGLAPVSLGAVRVRLAFPPNLDTDGDGLLDNWEIAFDLNPNSSNGQHGAGGDPDNDGHSNAQEQMAGTDPRDGNSVLRLSLTPVDAAFYRIGWQAVPGKRYQLEYADGDIAQFNALPGANWPRMALAPLEVYEDDVSMSTPPQSLRAYRVRLVEP
jgi:predicted phosphodiesterase